jgi:phosphotransferase system HPr (HPr) family protein
LLVRLATSLAAEVELRKGSRKADARKIIDVLALGAADGDQIEIETRGEDAESALTAIVELVSRGFSADLVPETGSAVVEGVAVGRAVVMMGETETAAAPRSVDEEIARARASISRADEELEQLIATLPMNEAALFEPERAIVQDAGARIEAEIAGGNSAEAAVAAVLGGGASDLFADARARLLDALAGSNNVALGRVRDSASGDLVLVTDRLTPSLVASLPTSVRGIIAVHHDGGSGMHSSHAAILARGRGVPLAIVPLHVASSLADGEEVMVDTTASPARVWGGPSPQLVEEGRGRQQAIERAREDDGRTVAELASRLAVEFWVNVGALQERVPASARGVGLLRTELLFATRSRAPSEDEQYASLVAIARSAGGKVVTVRLFDAGGDKPLAWLSPRVDERGMAVLFANADVLDTQLRAIARASESAAMRVLLPMCRSASDVQSVRTRLSSLKIGAMIETPEAAQDAANIAQAADFVCIGTNDLAAVMLGAGRTSAASALHPCVLAVVKGVICAAHVHGRRVTVCGEVAAHPRGSRVLIGLGVDALSVATTRFADVVRTLSTATSEECSAAAEASLSEAR